MSKKAYPNRNRNTVRLRKDDLFFVSSAKGFDVEKMELHPLTKTRWRTKCNRAAESDRYRRYIQLLLDITAFEEGIKILDVGCGVGAEVIELSYLGANCVGFDANKHHIQLIGAVKDHFGLKNLTAIYGNSCNLPFHDETFDVVMSFEFFEHAADPDLALNEQMRVLKRGGRLIIEQANLLDPFVLLDFLVKIPLRKSDKTSGMKWLFSKSKVIKDYGGLGWDGKDENVHSRLWWWRKMNDIVKRFFDIEDITVV